MLKNEKGLSIVELIVIVAVILVIAGCAVFLAVDEEGFSLFNDTNVTNEDDTNTTNEIESQNEEENEVEDEVIDDTVYQG